LLNHNFPTNAAVGVVGSRTFNHKPWLFSVLDYYHTTYGIREIVSGGAIGADTFGEEWAKLKQIEKLTIWLAQWDKFGKSAGFIRNPKIVESSEIVIAFLTPTSTGTHNTIDYATTKGTPVIICKHALDYIGLEVNDYEIKNC